MLLPVVASFTLAACAGGTTEQAGITPQQAGAQAAVSPPVTSPTATAAPQNSAPTIAGNPSAFVIVNATYRFQPVAADADSDPLVFSIENRPEWAAFDTRTGELSGVPGPASVGTTAAIVIGVSDGRTIAELLPFAIEVRLPPNAAPTVTGQPQPRLTVGTAYVFQPTASDPDRDTLTFDVVGLPAWASFDAATGRLAGTPTASHVGTSEPITIGVTDGRARTTLPSFSIAVEAPRLPAAPASNVPPTLSGAAGTRVAAGAPYLFQPVALDTDGDRMTFAIQNKPRWATFEPSSGRLAGTPGRPDVGVTTGIVISVSDGTTSTSTAPFSIEVLPAENRAPRISGTARSTVRVGEQYEFAPVADDPDGDVLAFSISNRPAWASFDTSSGRLSGVPGRGDTGFGDNIVITVSDGTTTTSTPAFRIEVQRAANRAPTIAGSPPRSATVGQAYSFTPTASDPDDDALNFTISNRPAWAAFDARSGRLSGTPAGGDVGTTVGITISVSDGESGAALEAFSLTVLQTSNGSSIIEWVPPTTNTDGSALADLAGYRIAYGTSPLSLTRSIQITNAGVSSYLVDNLTPGIWHFAVIAYNQAGVESRPSVTVSKSIP